jgi:predicted outer membrane repeat protein
MKPSILAFGMLSASLLPCLVALPAKAATITTGAACSLAQAIESANTNAAVGGCAAGAAGRDRIVVALNETLSVANNGDNGLPVVVEDLLITASSGARIISRDYTVGTPDFRFLEIGTSGTPASVTISNLYLQNGRVTGAVGPFGVGGGAGGCIYLRNGTLKIEDSVLQECVAEGDDNPVGNGASATGGAIYAIAGTLEIRNSSLVLNNAYGGDSGAANFIGGVAQGGAIQASGLASILIEDCVFDSNFAVGGAGVTTGGLAKGGAISLSNAAGSIANSSFSANAITGGVASSGTNGQSIGGALALNAVTLTFTESDLALNVANGSDNALATGGYAKGGALHAELSTLTFEQGAISENRATAGDGSSDASDGLAQGGGLFLSDTTATLNGVSIDVNTVSGAGPAGGAINIVNVNGTDETILITHSTIAYNNAIASHDFAHGGAIHQAGEILTIRNAAISDNNADDGGALFQESGSAKASLSTFSSNSARRNGGAIALDSSYLLAHTVELANVTVSGNSADLNGGGIYVKGTPSSPDAATLILANAIVTNNTNGGVYLAEGLTEPVFQSGNSIVGAQANGADCTVSGAVILTSNGGNLESGTACGFTHTADRQSVADLGLAPLGANGGETLTHALLAGSPAIDGGRQRICNRDADKKDQNGDARFYDGNSDREFACDSGPVEYQGLLANPGFEEPLGSGDWTLVASGGGDGRARHAATPNGKFALTFQANSALETISQSRPIAGNAGETYTLTMLGQGAGLTVGERMTVLIETLSGGTVVDTETCNIPFKTAAFVGSPKACVLSTTGVYDTVRTTIGWDGATTGSVTLDAITLTQG